MACFVSCQAAWCCQRPTASSRSSSSAAEAASPPCWWPTVSGESSRGCRRSGSHPARAPLRLPTLMGDCATVSSLTQPPGPCRKSTWFIIDEEGHKSILHADKRNIISVGSRGCDCLAGLWCTSSQARALSSCFGQPTFFNSRHHGGRMGDSCCDICLDRWGWQLKSILLLPGSV